LCHEKAPDVASLLQEFDNDAVTRLVTEAAAETVPAEESARILMDSIRRLRDRSFERELARLTQQISNPATCDERDVHPAG
jgi:hypothetical protein